MKTLIMDLGNTIIKNVSFDYEKARRMLYDLSIIKDESIDEFLNIAKCTAEKMYSTRNIDDIEIKYTDYIKNLKLACNTKYEKSIKDIEMMVYKSTVKDEKIADANLFLKHMKAKNYKIIVISNSTFSKECLEYTCKCLDVYDYIDELYVSSKYNIRKPSKALFEKLKIDLTDAIYIGNDNYYDGIFAKNMGIDFYWYNRLNEIDLNNVAKFSFKNYQELEEYIDGIKL